MWKVALRSAALGVLLVVASTEIPYNQSAQAYFNICQETNCFATMTECHGYYLMEDEQPCEYNPSNPSATNNYRFTCYGPLGEPSFITYCAN